MFIDSHCHLDFPEYQERLPEVLENMARAKVTHALCISVDIPDFPKVKLLAQSHPNLFASVGVHPDYEDITEPSVEKLLELADHSRVIGIGETGLDYFYAPDSKLSQQQAFVSHIEVANQLNKPLIIHTRDARADTLALMRSHQADKCGGVLHCFTENWEMAKAALDLGFYISFSGIVTFKNAKALKEVAQNVPLDRMLIETDAPYLAPVPKRGKRNEPSYLVLIANRVAELMQQPVTEVAAVTSQNARNLFKL